MKTNQSETKEEPWRLYPPFSAKREVNDSKFGENTDHYLQFDVNCAYSDDQRQNVYAFRRESWSQILFITNSKSKPDVFGKSNVFIPFLLTLLMSSLASTIAGVVGHSTATLPQLPPACYRQFGQRIRACAEPFTSLVALHDSQTIQPRNRQFLAKHICQEYQMVLQCLHSALLDCPTLRNLRRVQNELNSHWLVRLNDLCAVQSESLKKEHHHEVRTLKNEDYQELGNYLGKNRLPQQRYSYAVADEILRVSKTARKELEKGTTNKALHRELIRRYPASTRQTGIFLDRRFHPRSTHNIKDSTTSNKLNAGHHERNADANRWKDFRLSVLNIIQNCNYREHGSSTSRDDADLINFPLTQRNLINDGVQHSGIFSVWIGWFAWVLPYWLLLF